MDCQLYPFLLAVLSMAKKTAIACTYPVMFILKLRHFGAFNPIAYLRIKSHTVFFLQNPAPLLTFFSSLILALYDIIRII